MHQNKTPPSLRGLLVLAAAAALACLAFAFFHRGSLPAGGAPRLPPAAARAPRSARPVDVTVRPRAGITGHVLDPARKPVAAASVCAWASPGDGLVTRQTRIPRCAIADEAGAYALTDLFPATPLVVSASAAGFAPVGYRAPNGDGSLRLGDGEQRAGVDIVLRGGGVPLRGSVVDVTGGGVAGALVVTEGGVDRALATSDAKGAFTLWVEPGAVTVSATASGYAPGSARGPAPDHFFTIHLVPGATLVGRAVIAGGETPVSGVFIEGIQMEGGYGRASTLTDDDGRFRIEGLAPGRYRVEATSEGREGYSPSSVTLAMGETSSEVLIALDPAYVVRGRVIDKATREPCQGGEVVILDRKQNEFSRAAIDPDGWARMASVIPGTYGVDVRCKDHVERDDYPTVTVKDEDAPPLTWEVDKGAALRVAVADGQGRPVTKADVMAYASGPEGSSGRTDHVETDGAFLLAGLKPGSYRVSVYLADGGRADKDVEVTLGREERLSIDVPPSGVIDGIVEDDAHNPVADVQVTASGSGFASTRSLDDGTFQLTGLGSGEYELSTTERSPRLEAPQAEPAPAVKVTVAPPDRARVTLTVGGHGGTIEGRVTDGAGEPVTDAFIDFVPAGSGSGMLRYGGSGRAPIVTDTEGRFTIDGLADGAYDLRASRKGGGEANAAGVAAGTRGLDLKLSDGGSIAGSLTSRGAPVERFTLRVREQKTAFVREELFFHAQGLFALQALPAGTYEVEAETPDGTASTQVTLAEGEQKSGIALTLGLRGAVDGVLVDLESGAPIAGVPLSVDGSSRVALMNGDSRAYRSGADGRFHLEGVLAGAWTLTAIPSDPAFAMASVPIVVQDGGATTDVGAVRLARRRVAPGEPSGILGLYVNQGSDAPGEVKMVFGAAAAAGIQVGDVVVSVDGFDVRPPNQYLLSPLTSVAPGRAVRFGLGRGTTVSVVAEGREPPAD